MESSPEYERHFRKTWRVGSVETTRMVKTGQIEKLMRVTCVWRCAVLVKEIGRSQLSHYFVNLGYFGYQADSMPRLELAILPTVRSNLFVEVPLSLGSRKSVVLLQSHVA